MKDNIIRQPNERCDIDFMRMVNQDRINVLEGNYIVEKKCKDGIKKYNLLNAYDRDWHDKEYGTCITFEWGNNVWNKIKYTIFDENNNSTMCVFEYDTKIWRDLRKLFNVTSKKDVGDHHYENCLYLVDQDNKSKTKTIFYNFDDFIKNKGHFEVVYFWDRKTNELTKETNVFEKYKPQPLSRFAREMNKNNNFNAWDEHPSMKRIKILVGNPIIEKETKEGTNQYNLLNSGDIIKYKLENNEDVVINKNKQTYSIIKKSDNSLICKFKYNVKIWQDVRKLAMECLEKEYGNVEIGIIGDATCYDNSFFVYYEYDAYINSIERDINSIHIFYKKEDFLANKSKSNTFYFWDRKTNKLCKE